MNFIYDDFVKGLGCAAALPDAMSLLVKSRTLKSKTIQCFVLNACIVLGSVFILNNVIQPVVHTVLPASESTATLNVIVKMIYEVCWLYPMYSLSILLNAMTYQTIASASYALQFGTKMNTFTYTWFIQQLGDQAYRLILCLFFLAHTLVLEFIPFIGLILSVVFVSWLYSFYCFEYVWGLSQWQLEKQISLFEGRWAFFLGFGMPCSIIAHVYPLVVSGAIIGALFPICIIMATIAEVPPPPPNSKFPIRIQLFSSSRYLTLATIHLFWKIYSKKTQPKSH
eukprot:c12372_g1_i1.p1 GENE.c12372_g1_i1~~c12372_g1_i1.p1  ORF type:complete len:282 (+),score=64.05 c12372_g1_i1:133-978(+)